MNRFDTFLCIDKLHISVSICEFPNCAPRKKFWPAPVWFICFFLWCWDPSISFLLMVIYCFDSTMFCSIFLKSSFKFFCFISNFPNDEILLWLSNDLLNFSQIQFFCFISHFPNPTFPYERRWHLIWRSSLPSPHFLMVPIYFLPQFHFFSCIVYSRTNPLTTLAWLVLTFETLTELEKI